MKSRAKVSKNTQHQDQELVDTTKVLIEIYKSAFGAEWSGVFAATVRVSISTN